MFQAYALPFGLLAIVFLGRQAMRWAKHLYTPPQEWRFDKFLLSLLLLLLLLHTLPLLAPVTLASKS